MWDHSFFFSQSCIWGFKRQLKWGDTAERLHTLCPSVIITHCQGQISFGYNVDRLEPSCDFWGLVEMHHIKSHVTLRLQQPCCRTWLKRNVLTWQVWSCPQAARPPLSPAACAPVWLDWTLTDCWDTKHDKRLLHFTPVPELWELTAARRQMNLQLMWSKDNQFNKKRREEDF